MFRVTTSKYQQLSLQIVSRDLRRIVARTTVSISGSDKANTHLFKSLTLDCVDTNNYRASAKSLWRPVGSRFVFGGQVVGQALTAAFNTVQEPLLLHSLHCYFLRGGSNEKPILYNVDRTRDGKTYSSRSIKATQDGVPIFTMQASFKVEETDPLEHQFKMPVVPNPEELISSKDYLKKILETKKLTESQRLQLSEYLTHSSYIEFRPLDPQVYHGQQQGEPRRYVWVRVMEQIGNQENAILYYVDRTRDGKTYSNRNIKATQDGVPIFSMQASFKIDETDPLEHQFTMPVVTEPEDLISSRDYMRNRLKTEELTDVERRRLTDYVNQPFYIETRPVDPELYFRLKQGEPRSYIWVRAMEDIGDNAHIQQCLGGFLSDFGMVLSARQPAPVEHKIGFISSLDHSMWFHNPFRAQEWMLCEIESPQCGKGKALALGRMWRRDGVLAVSMAQEGVIRSSM
ncbi:acyl-coenzyme A thioesterase 8-like [Ostrea edulis]|uniref:acyl-coenzyme A thioesterase 8-like n=1 Tax=Ostrea edulis TaxID=37623 RepID=UPI0024AEBFD5|nr:acyl-coenzyme A thioesterase 8-like [Ostrea edulis]